MATNKSTNYCEAAPPFDLRTPERVAPLLAAPGSRQPRRRAHYPRNIVAAVEVVAGATVTMTAVTEAAAVAAAFAVPAETDASAACAGVGNSAQTLC